MPDNNMLDEHPHLKKFIHWCIINPTLSRPRCWIRLLRPFYTKAAWSSKIYHSARMDVVPWHRFELGPKSVVESYSCINNAVGDVLIDDHSRIGLHNTIIGPVRIGAHVNLAQGVVVSGLNHVYERADKRIDEQPVSVSEIVIEDDVWIGANVTITAGVRIGHHSVIGAGSVVTRNIPSCSVAVGSPAQVIKQTPAEGLPIF